VYALLRLTFSADRRYPQSEALFCSSCSSASARYSIQTGSEIVLTDNSSLNDWQSKETDYGKTQYWFLHRLNSMSEIHDLLAE